MSRKTDKIQQNGITGQERTSGLLSERFWVLKRQVDIHGADFLVQLQDETETFSDPLPPRLCTVQSKYCQDRNTSHEIPAKYVLDEDGQPRRGFFVLIHMGGSDDNIRYLLSAAEIRSALRRDEKKDVFKIQAGTTYTDTFRKKTGESVLQIIEKELIELRDMDRLRFNIPFYELKRTRIDRKWIIPIPNEHEFIPDAVFFLKNLIRMTLEENAAEYEIMAKMMTESDVSVIISLLDKLADWIDQDPDAPQTTVFDVKGNIRELHGSLAKAVAIHTRRFELLCEDDNKIRSFIDFCNSVGEAGYRIFEKMKPVKQRVSDNSYRSLPVRCTIKFDVEPGKHDQVVIDQIRGDTSVFPALTANERRVEGPIFIDFLRDGRAGGLRDMNRLIVSACAVYFGALFPDEAVMSPKMPKVMAD
ncbi:hypothetical protein [Paraburkholderia sp. MM5384-R2]|uniref:hypothetical protein n=1 Tax=Paraburkholderia sp. MM5384-R2 TaxID=2723097 RepID=UPI00161426CD|nr:hypothetical protein [Paraburkholderia sp. MM5384-R2]MBB5503252.1 hypothetical protein [Paraburkholderia sp. MM5384-R2]